MDIDKVGIDLGKTVFHLVGRCERFSETVFRKRFSRPQLCDQVSCREWAFRFNHYGDCQTRQLPDT